MVPAIFLFIFMGGVTCGFSMLLARAFCQDAQSAAALERFRTLAGLVFLLVLVAFGLVFSQVLPDGENRFWVMLPLGWLTAVVFGLVLGLSLALAKLRKRLGEKGA